MKALNFRALAVWICLFLFLVFLTLRLDDKIVWSWYIVFIPLWILDAVIFYLVAALAINICSMTIAAPPRRTRVIQLMFYMAVSLIQLCGQILICFKLENRSFSKYYIILIPVWVMLIVFIVDIARYLFCRSLPCFDKQPPRLNQTRTRRYGVVIR